MVVLIRCGAVGEFGGYVAGLVALRMLLEEIGEEKDLEHHKDDEQLDEYDGPQRPAQAHVPETVGVEVVDTIEKVVLPHRL